jgi:hypothetical protein
MKVKNAWTWTSIPPKLLHDKRLNKHRYNRASTSLPCGSIAKEMQCARMRLLREADGADSAKYSAKYSASSIWSLLGNTDCFWIYCLIHRSCTELLTCFLKVRGLNHFFFGGRRGDRKNKTYNNKKQNYQSTPFPMFDCRFWGLQMRVVGLYLR